MKVLITGAAGFIGCRFCEYMLEYHQDVTILAIDNLSGGYIDNVPKDNRLQFLQADLTIKEDQERITELIERSDEKLDYIFHFACYAAEGLSPFIRQYNYSNNVMASAFLINCGIKYAIKRFVFTSSMAVYGHGNGEGAFDETLLPAPIDPYGIGKYCVEMDLAVAYTQHKMEYCIIRPHNVYGIKQNIQDPYRNVLGIWMYKSLHNNPFTIYGDGEQTRAFSYVDDILPCLWTAAVKKEAKNEIINLGGKVHTTLNQAAKLLLHITQNPHVPVYLEPRHEVKHAWPTYTKSVELLDYKETIDLEEGLRRTWEWAKTSQDYPQKFFEKYELDKGIYSYWKLVETE
jgi:UDP-glucose 4-epimerase